MENEEAKHKKGNLSNFYIYKCELLKKKNLGFYWAISSVHEQEKKQPHTNNLPDLAHII